MLVLLLSLLIYSTAVLFKLSIASLGSGLPFTYVLFVTLYTFGCITYFFFTRNASKTWYTLLIFCLIVSALWLYLIDDLSVQLIVLGSSFMGGVYAVGLADVILFLFYIFMPLIAATTFVLMHPPSMIVQREQELFAKKLSSFLITRYSFVLVCLLIALYYVPQLATTLGLFRMPAGFEFEGFFNSLVLRNIFWWLVIKNAIAVSIIAITLRGMGITISRLLLPVVGIQLLTTLLLKYVSIVISAGNLYQISVRLTGSSQILFYGVAIINVLIVVSLSHSFAHLIFQNNKQLKLKVALLLTCIYIATSFISLI